MIYRGVSFKLFFMLQKWITVNTVYHFKSAKEKIIIWEG